jgi:hypothetical protein
MGYSVLRYLLAKNGIIGIYSIKAFTSLSAMIVF